MPFYGKNETGQRAPVSNSRCPLAETEWETSDVVAFLGTGYRDAYRAAT